MLVEKSCQFLPSLPTTANSPQKLRVIQKNGSHFYCSQDLLLPLPRPRVLDSTYNWPWKTNYSWFVSPTCCWGIHTVRKAQEMLSQRLQESVDGYWAGDEGFVMRRDARILHQMMDVCWSQGVELRGHGHGKKVLNTRLSYKMVEKYSNEWNIPGTRNHLCGEHMHKISICFSLR